MIYLLRHGDAEDSHGDDAAPPVSRSDSNRRSARRIADGSTLHALLRPADLAAIAR